MYEWEFDYDKVTNLGTEKVARLERSGLTNATLSLSASFFDKEMSCRIKC